MDAPPQLVLAFEGDERPVEERRTANAAARPPAATRPDTTYGRPAISGVASTMMSEVAFFVKDVVGPKGCVSIVDRAGAEE